mgnify:CR=1 FL=1
MFVWDISLVNCARENKHIEYGEDFCKLCQETGDKKAYHANYVSYLYNKIALSGYI